jgi:hypothetical protein
MIKCGSSMSSVDSTNFKNNSPRYELMASHSANISFKNSILLTQHSIEFLKRNVEGKSSSFLTHSTLYIIHPFLHL